MRRTPPRYAEPRQARKNVIGTWSPEFTVSAHPRIVASAISTGLPAANDPYAFPFRLSECVFVNEFLLYAGSAGGGNFDMGVYTSAWAKVISTGSTAATLSNLFEIVNVTDTKLNPGVTYYLVLVRDNATANRQRSYSGSLTTAQNALAGVQDSTTDAFPLPDPLTNMALATAITQIPIMGFTCRSAF